MDEHDIWAIWMLFAGTCVGAMLCKMIDMMEK